MNKKVKFSVRIHQGGYDYESLNRIWMDADRLGYYSATLYDLLNVPTLECWTTLSALAAQTTGIRLTPLVLANTYRHPAVFAKWPRRWMSSVTAEWRSALALEVEGQTTRLRDSTSRPRRQGPGCWKSPSR